MRFFAKTSGPMFLQLFWGLLIIVCHYSWLSPTIGPMMRCLQSLKSIRIYVCSHKANCTVRCLFSASCNVQCAMRNLQCEMWNVNWAIWSLWKAMYSVQWVGNVLSPLWNCSHRAHCAFYPLSGTLFPQSSRPQLPQALLYSNVRFSPLIFPIVFPSLVGRSVRAVEK